MEKKLLIITYALPQEIEELDLRNAISDHKKAWFEKKLRPIERLKVRLNRRHYEKECILIETGIGKVNAYNELFKILDGARKYLGPNAKISVLNLGTVASVNANIGDVVECNRFIDRDLISLSQYIDTPELYLVGQDGERTPKRTADIPMKPSITDYYYHERYSCNSGDSFVTDPDDAHQMRDGWTAVCDMEGFSNAHAVADASKRFNEPISFRCVKYITDKIGEDNSLEGWEEELPAARMTLTKEALNVIREYYSEI